MANPEHFEIFQQGTEAWNAWRRQHHLVRPDLSRADLEKANLRSANLNHTNLSYANLAGANLGRAYLEAAELQGSTPRGAHLFEADLGRADLREMDLREAQLWHARLEGSNLRDANLTGADLRYADLTDADLRDAVLASANLTGAQLLRADLRNTDLRNTDLTDARLRDNRLEGVELAGARFARTTLGHLDLAVAAGLADTRHERASSVGTDTLDLTALGLTRHPGRRGEVVTFLRRAGVQEPYLELLRSEADDPSRLYTVYLRSSVADQDFARRLYDALQGHGIRCWLDQHPMVAGDDFEEDFDLRLHPADRLLLLCSEASLTSWWLPSELDQATEKENLLRTAQNGHRRALLAVDLDGYLASGRWPSPRKEQLEPRLVADFRSWRSDEDAFHRGVDRLVEALGEKG